MTANHLILLKNLIISNDIDKTYMFIRNKYKCASRLVKLAKDIYKENPQITVKQIDKMIMGFYGSEE